MARGKPGNDLYIIQMHTTGAFKVGRTCDIDRRLGELQTGAPYKLKVLLHAPGQGHRERDVHRALHYAKTRFGSGEWFHESGLGGVPDDLWDMVPVEVLEDPDWWKRH